jgi:hypothetical protein
MSNKPERLLGSVTETHVMEGNLDISVLVHEFDAAIKALKVASDNAGNNFEDNVIFHASFLILVDEVLKYNSDCSHNGNNESSPSEGSQMISESPLDRDQDTCWFITLFAFIRSVTSEVPQAN